MPPRGHVTQFPVGSTVRIVDYEKLHHLRGGVVTGHGSSTVQVSVDGDLDLYRPETLVLARTSADPQQAAPDTAEQEQQ